MAPPISISSSLSDNSLESEYLNKKNSTNGNTVSPVHSTPSPDMSMLTTNSDDSDATEESWMNFTTVETIQGNASNPILINSSSSAYTVTPLDMTPPLSDIEMEQAYNEDTQGTASNPIIVSSPSSTDDLTMFTDFTSLAAGSETQSSTYSATNYGKMQSATSDSTILKSPSSSDYTTCSTGFNSSPTSSDVNPLLITEQPFTSATTYSSTVSI